MARKDKQQSGVVQLSLFDFTSPAPAAVAPRQPEPEPVIEPEIVREIPVEEPEDILFRAKSGFDLEGGEKALFRRNMEALYVLQSLRERNVTRATANEKEILSRYMGWGGAPHVFLAGNESWTREYNELRNFLSPVEYAQARNSIQNAYYTPDSVISGMWAALSRMGVSENQWMSVLEPSAGIGNFASYRPQGINPDFYFVEQDPISSTILSWLYPETKRFSSGFQFYWQTKPVYDIAIGNPPFGRTTLYDGNFRELSDLSIHNYFLVKSMRLVRDGGIGAFVVSRYFMDAHGSTARGMISNNSRFLGAIRLPTSAFARSARVDVTTDIVFFQKGASDDSSQWVVNDGSIVNPYFFDHPEMVIGEMKDSYSERYGRNDIVVEFDGDLREALMEKIELLPEKIFKHRDKPASARTMVDMEFVDSAYFMSLKQGSFAIAPSGAIVVKDYYFYSDYPLKDNKSRARLTAMIGIRDTLRALVNAEKTDGVTDEELLSLRRTLNIDYDSFMKKYGYLNAAVNARLMRDDPEWALVSALETDYNPGISEREAEQKGVDPVPPKAGKADIFRKRILHPEHETGEVSTISDAFLLSLQLYGKINVPFIASKLDIAEEEARERLLHSGQVFVNPETMEMEIRDKYLSGNVKHKLEKAKEAAENDPAFGINVAELENVLPADIQSVDIGVKFGASWVPPEIYEDFLKDLTDDQCICSLHYIPVIGKWNIQVAITNYILDTETFGIRDFPAENIIKHLFSGTPIIVKDAIHQNGETIYVVNHEKTIIAKQKAEIITTQFQDWLWQDDKRRHTLETIYNSKFNTHLPPTYDGSHLKPVGMSESISLRPHQKNAVWRALQEGSVLFDHVVGSGKTMIAITTIMESKRMGLMSKPMVVVPNHLLSPWKQEFYRLYPSANVLCATADDFQAQNRDKLFARIAVNDWDAIIVAHSSFGFIPAPVEFQKEFIQSQEDEYANEMARIRINQGERENVKLIKAIERARDNFQKKTSKLLSKLNKTRVIDFADLGVDALFVDESQEFKNLFFNSSMRVAGLGTQEGSGKALDMFIKCRYIQTKNNGRGVFFMTGTPISNTIAELYTIQRYLRYDQLQEKGLTFFDEWASVFGQVAENWELDGTGVKYKLASRFSKFQNVPELLAFYRSFADTVTHADLEKAGLALPVPKIKGDAPENNVVERSEAQARYMSSIIDRMTHLPPNPSEDNPLKITNDARKAGLDYRLIDPIADDYEGSKINYAVKSIYEIWERTREQKGTQLVFCDLSTPKMFKKKQIEDIRAALDVKSDTDGKRSVDMDDILSAYSDFSVYDDIRKKLVAMGVPTGEIAFIHDANTEVRKASLYRNMNDGNVRILLGSTSKMGAGTNVQRRLIAVHHLDAPWRPSDIEQRNGRIIRQGNMFYENDPENFRIEIHNYATRQTYDSRMWQVIEYKWRAIDQFRQGNILQRVIDDVSIGSATAAEMKAAASGNPLILDEVRLAGELRSLEAAYAEFQRGQHRMRDRIPWLSQSEERLIQAKERYEEDRKRLLEKTEWVMKDGVRKIDWKMRFQDKIIEPENGMKSHYTIISEKCRKHPMQEQFFGEYRGFGIYAARHTSYSRQHSFNEGIMFSIRGHGKQMYYPGTLIYTAMTDFNPRGFFQKLDYFFAGNFQEEYGKAVEMAGKEKKELEQINTMLEAEFPNMEKLTETRKQHQEVLAALKKQMQEEQEKENQPEEDEGCTANPEM